MAIFEHNGKLSILPKTVNRPATPEDLNITVKTAHIDVEVIVDGRILGENLSRMGRDEKWLETQIKSQRYGDAKEIFLGIYRPEEDQLTPYQTSDRAYTDTVPGLEVSLCSITIVVSTSRSETTARSRLFSTSTTRQI